MSGILSRLKTKLRGIIGLGLLGGGAGFAIGVVWSVVENLMSTGLLWTSGYLRFLATMALGNGIGFALIGTFTTAGFGVLLSAADSKRSLDELPLWRMALFGAVAGAVFPPVFLITRLGLGGYLEVAASLLPISGVLGLVGGVATSSLVAIAKRADRRQIRGPDAGVAELGGESKP